MVKYTVDTTSSANNLCMHPDCGRQVLARNLCGRHYQRARAAGMPPSIPRIKDFWDEVDMSSGPESCWTWQRGSQTRPHFEYGLLKRKGWEKYAHRQAWVLANGPIPAGLHVMHTCDRPPCCNPKHLVLGTRSDNMRDKVRKGRANQPFGDDHPGAKLTADDVRQIRRMAAQGFYQYEIGLYFDVHQHTVWAIASGKTWAKVA